MAAVQRAIGAGMKPGGSCGTSHKESSTNSYWRHGKLVRFDYGDDPDFTEYEDEAELLQNVWLFCQFDVKRHAGRRELPELDIWKLILRWMSTSSPA